jgi:hypothetical protein
MQHRMLDAIVNERGNEGLPVFVSQGAMTADERLDVYRSAYRSRLVECLADDYPALRHALGEEAFERLCHAYIAAHPSRSPSLNVFGRLLPRFVRGHDALQGGFLSDLARLEWALVEAVHAPSSDAVSPEVVAQVPTEAWEGVRLLPCVWYAWLDFDYPADAYYQAFREDLDPALPDPLATTIVVLRDGLALRRVSVAPGLRVLLRRLLAQDPLGVATGELDPNVDPTLVQSSFQTWVASGLFSGLQLSPT